MMGCCDSNSKVQTQITGVTHRNPAEMIFSLSASKSSDKAPDYDPILPDKGIC